VLDDVRKEIHARFGDPNPDPMKAGDKIRSQKSNSLSSWAERLYRESVRKGEPFTPAEIGDILESGKIEAGAVVPGPDGEHYVVDRVRNVGQDGTPIYYYTNKKPRKATPEEVVKATNANRKYPVPQPGAADSPEAIRSPGQPSQQPTPVGGVGGAPPAAPLGAASASIPQSSLLAAPRPSTYDPEEGARSRSTEIDADVEKVRKLISSGALVGANKEWARYVLSQRPNAFTAEEKAVIAGRSVRRM